MNNDNPTILDSESVSITGFDAPLSEEQQDIAAANKRASRLTKESKLVADMLRTTVMPPNLTSFSYPHKLYAVEIAFDDRIYGGKPMGDDLITPWLTARFRKEIESGRVTDNDLREVLSQVKAQSDETRDILKKAVKAKLGDSNIDDIESKIDELGESTATRFMADSIGFYIEAYLIKAGLKLAASVGGFTRDLKGTGSKIGMKDIMQHLVHVFPLRVYLARFDKGLPEDSTEAAFGVMPSAPNQKLDEQDQGIWHVGRGWTPEEHVSPGHVSGPTGERSILKRRQYISGDPSSGNALRIRFAIKVAKCQDHVDEKMLALLMAIGEDNGLGADRAQGGGRYEVLGGPTCVRNYDPPMVIPTGKKPAAAPTGDGTEAPKSKGKAPRATK